MVSFLTHTEGPEKSHITVTDHADTSKVFFLLDGVNRAENDVLLHVVIYDEAHYLFSSMQRTALANTLLQWVASNNCVSVIPVLKSVADFDNYMRLSAGEEFAENETNTI